MNQSSSRQLASLSIKNIKKKSSYTTRVIDITGKHNVDYSKELYQYLSTGGLYLIFKHASQYTNVQKYKFLFVRCRKSENIVENTMSFSYDELLLWYDDMTRKLNEPEDEEIYDDFEDYDDGHSQNIDEDIPKLIHIGPIKEQLDDINNVLINNVPAMMPVKPDKVPSEFLSYFEETKPITADEFRADVLNLKHKGVPGCYVIYDVVEKKYYVGQAGNLWRRMCDHLNKGKFLKGSCYQIDENIRNGHKVYIRVIRIGIGDIYDLNEMEYKLIDAYDSYYKNGHGYNLTQGNHRK